MKNRHLQLWLAFVVVAGMIAVPQMRAQFAKAPETYSITEVNAMLANGGMMHIYRDGSEALTDVVISTGGGSTPTSHTRTLYDMQAHTTYSWTVGDALGNCTNGTYTGDWGDSFAASATMTADLAQPGVKQTGTETLNGFATKVYEITGKTPQESGKAWVDTKYGLVIKAQFGGTMTLVEVKQLSLEKPAASLFALPAGCKTAAAKGPAATPGQQTGADTGIKNPQDCADAGLPPASGSPSSCTALFKIVRAGTMEPMTNISAIGVDLDQNSTGGYTMGTGANGSHFVGGTIKDMTSQYRNGVLRIDNVPPHFMIDVEFSESSSANALIYRQCFQPQTVLTLMVKNPQDMADGKVRWLWSKTGK